jgi:hypothetical protein
MHPIRTCELLFPILRRVGAAFFLRLSNTPFFLFILLPTSPSELHRFVLERAD